MTQQIPADTGPQSSALSAVHEPNDSTQVHIAIGKCIKAHRLQRGWNLGDLADKIKMDRGNLSRVENGHAGLTTERIQSLAKAFNIPIPQLFENPFGPDWNGKPPPPARIPKSAAAPESSKPRPIKSYQSLRDVPEASVVLVDSIRSLPNAAEGESNWKADSGIPIRLPGLFMRELRCAPADLLALTVSNDAMVPLLYQHDIVIIDISDQLPPGTGGVFAVAFPGQPVELRKLFSKIDGGLTVRCYNPHYPATELTPTERKQLQIIGRVISAFGNSGF
jgi:phage repressor protein C with HTH and peptisase S24 domain